MRIYANGCDWILHSGCWFAPTNQLLSTKLTLSSSTDFPKKTDKAAYCVSRTCTYTSTYRQKTTWQVCESASNKDPCPYRRITDEDPKRSHSTRQPHVTHAIPLFPLPIEYSTHPPVSVFFGISHTAISNITVTSTSSTICLFCFFLLLSYICTNPLSRPLALRPHSRFSLASPIHPSCFVIARAAKGSSVREVKLPG